MWKKASSRSCSGSRGFTILDLALAIFVLAGISYFFLPRHPLVPKATESDWRKFADLLPVSQAPGKGGTEQVSLVTVSQDGKWVAGRCGDYSVRIWDIASHQLKRQIKYEELINTGEDALAFSPDGKYLATVGSGNGAITSVKVWPVEPDSPPIIIPLDSGKGGRALQFSPDGNLLAIGNVGNLLVWDLTSGSRRATFPAHQNWITKMAFSPDGKILATGASNGAERVKFWEVSSWAELNGSPSVPGDPLCGLSFSPDGQLLLAAIQNEIVLWDLKTGNRLQSYKLNGCNAQFLSNDLIITREMQAIYLHSGLAKRLLPQDQYESIQSWDLSATTQTLVRAVLYYDDPCNGRPGCFAGIIKIGGYRIEVWKKPSS